MTDFTTATGPDGVAVITWDVPARSMNVLSYTGLAELEAEFDAALADPGVKGIVITSAKKDFAGGMDLNIIARMKTDAGDEPARGLFDGIMGMHRILRKIERAGTDPKTLKGGKPVAAALPGTALGIGLEIPLACHRIFAADNPRAKIGLPEIMVGIFPGAGGTTRLVRKLGPMMAAPFLLEGKTDSPAKMKAAGIVDEVVPAEDLLARARAWVLSATETDIVKPFDQKGYKMPGGAPYSAPGFPTFVGASAMVLGKTQGVYPAAKALLSAVYEGALVPFDTALKIEARWFTHVLMNPSSSAMIRSLFVNKEALEKGANRPKVPDQSVKRLGVIGAGMMGAGIAYVSANAGHRSGADRRHAGGRRQGPRAFRRPARQGHQARQGHAREKGRGAGPHHRDHRLRSPQGLRPDRRGGVRGCEGQGRRHRQGRRRHRRRHDLRHQHLHPAHHRPRPRLGARGELHRHPLLLPGGQDEPGRDHPWERDLRHRRRQGARFRPRDPQDAHRRQRRPVLLRQPLHHSLHQRRHPHGGRRASSPR